MRFLATVCLGASFLACGKKPDMGSIKLAMDGTSTASLTETELAGETNLLEPVATYTTPEYMKLKIIAVELVRQKDGNMQDIAIWASPGCNMQKQENDGDMNGKGAEEYYVADGCGLNDSISTIDVAQEPAKVNEQLNSGAFPVPPGNYVRAKIKFCGLNDSDELKNSGITFKGDTMAREFSSPTSVCGVSSADASFTIDEGQAATVTLNYDRTKLLQVNTSTERMSTIPESKWCLYDSGGYKYHCAAINASSTFSVSVGPQ